MSEKYNIPEVNSTDSIQESVLHVYEKEIEQVMGKVDNINKEGTAYTNICMEMSLAGMSLEKRFASAFSLGLLNPSLLKKM